MLLSTACVRRWTIRLRPSSSTPFAASVMFSKRTEPRAIASQLVLLFTLAATLLLSIGLGVSYWLVVRHAFAEDNAVLADKVSALKTDFKEGGPKIFGEEVRSRAAGQYEPYWIRVLDSERHTMTETPGMDRLLPLDVFPLPQNSTASISSKDYRISGKLFSLVAANQASGDQTYTVQVAQDRSSDEQLERKFGAVMATVLLCAIVASALIAVTITKRGLRSLGEMTRSLQQIGPNHLSERIT